MNEVAPGVLMWSEPSERLGYDLNGFLWTAGRETVVVDPPPPSAEARRHMEERARPTLIVVTNRTHWRATDEVRDASGARVAMSAIDSAAVDGTVDAILAPGDEVPGGWRVIDMAGKTKGEIGLYRAEGGGTLLVGDALIGDPPGELRLLPNRKIDDRAALGAALARLPALEFQRLLVGDGRPILEQADRRVRELVRELA